MKLFRRLKAVRDAIKREAEKEEGEKTRALLSASELTPEMIEKFLKACPADVEVRVYPSQGGQIVITRRAAAEAKELPRGPEW